MMGGLLNAYWPQKIRSLPWMMIWVVLGIGTFGGVVLYSAAGGSMKPWAINHAIRLSVFMAAAIVLSQVPLRWYLRHAYTLYGSVLVSLVAVEVMGAMGGGAQRWLDLGFIRLQPSEFMKLAIVLAIARFYHYLPRGYASKFTGIWPPLGLIALPVSLVLLQPDLGTSILITIGGLSVMFLGGLPLRYFIIPGITGLASLPILYSMLHEYQQRRVMTFLDPESDPLGAGYHITQSKIAIGSGGIFGKGFLEGSQSHLLYLPEQHTDFVFSAMAEEFGLIGGIGVLSAYLVLFLWGIRVGIASQSVFGRLVAAGLSMAIFFYILINCMMVMGMAPVVGLPFPLLSYGGSAMMTVLLGFGIVMATYRERKNDIV